MGKLSTEKSMLVDIQYVQKDRANNLEDCLYTIWKDIETGEKHVEKFEKPKVPIFIEKEEARNHTYSTEYARKEDLDMKVVEYQNIPFEIAKVMGDEGKRFIKGIQETRNYKELRQLNLYPYVYGQDYDVRALYRYSWLKNMNGKSPMKLRKGFLDIETDILSSPGMPRPTKDPIDLVTIADGENKECHTFILVGRPYEELSDREYARLVVSKEERKRLWEERRKQEEKLVANPDIIKEAAKREFDEKYPGFKYNVYFYTDEAKLIVHLFQCIHKISPDFLMIWNISFDIPYIIERCKVLGLNPADVICDAEFMNKVCKFHKDTHNFEIKNKSDHFEVSSKTVYVDQMENYAAIRKGRDELRQYRLDYIARKECEGEGKYIYEGKTASLRFLGYIDLLTYILYNIKDTLLQYGIEEVVLDIDNLYRNAYANITPYEYCYMQTVVLRNVQYKYYDQQGLVPGANTNKILIKIDMEQHPEKYAKRLKKPGIEGALVGNTRLINKFGQRLYGKRTNFIFIYSIDMDMKAFYPSTIMALNISKSTLIFKVVVDCDKYDVRGGKIPFHGFTDVELVEDNPVSFSGDISAEIFDNFQCGNILSTGRKFMNLPSISELVTEIEKEGGLVA